MKNAKRLIAGLLAVLMLLGIVFITTGCSGVTVDSVKRNPEKQLTESYKLTKQALEGSFATSPLHAISEALKNGYVKMWYTSEYDMSESLVIHANQVNKEYAMTIETETGDNKHTTSFYLNKQNFVVSAPHTFGDKAYGVNIQTMKEDMAASNIWQHLGITENEFMDMFGDVMTELEKFGSNQETPGYQEYKKMLEDIKAVTKQCTVTVEEHGILTGVEMVTAININYSMSMEQMHQIIDILFNWMEGSVFSDLISGSVDANAKLEMVSARNSDQETQPSDPAAQPEEETVFDTMKAELKKALKDANTTVDFTIAINPETKMIMKVEAELNCIIENLPQYITMSVDLGKNPATSPLQQARFAISNGEEEETALSVIYEKMDATGLYDRILKVRFTDPHTDESISARFQWNKTENVYTLMLDNNGTEATVSGKCKMNGNKLEITAEKVNEKTNEYEVDMHLVAETGVAVPKAPEYQNIFSASDKEMGDFVEMFEQAGSMLGKPDAGEDDWEDDWDDDEDDGFGNGVTISYVTASGSFGFVGLDTAATNLYDLLVAEEIAEISADGMFITELIDSEDPAGTQYQVYVNDFPVVGSMKDIEITDNMEVVITAK